MVVRDSFACVFENTGESLKNKVIVDINQVGGTNIDFRLSRCNGAYAPGGEAYRNKRDYLIVIPPRKPSR